MMKFLEVFLITTQLAFVACLPRNIRITGSPELLQSFPQVQTNGVLVSPSEEYRPLSSFHFTPDTFFISEPIQDRSVQDSPQLLKVTFSEGAEDRRQRLEVNQRPTGQRRTIVFEPSSPSHADRLARFGDYGYVIIPSRETSIDLSEKRNQQSTNPQIFIFRSTDVRPDVPAGTVQGNSPAPFIRMQTHSQAAGRVEQTQDRQLVSIRNSAPLTKLVSSKQSPERPEAGFVTRLTAPSNDPRSSNTFLITRRPCEICCVGNEVEPCKSCCAHTPLLNAKTLKTVVG